MAPSLRLVLTNKGARPQTRVESANAPIQRFTYKPIVEEAHALLEQFEDVHVKFHSVSRCTCAVGNIILINQYSACCSSSKPIRAPGRTAVKRATNNKGRAVLPFPYAIGQCLTPKTVFLRLKANTAAANAQIDDMHFKKINAKGLVIEKKTIEEAVKELIVIYAVHHDRRSELMLNLKMLVAKKVVGSA